MCKAKDPEQFTFHEAFETAIQRYTESSAKQNSVLRETRATDFCYPVTMTVEAVPLGKAKKPSNLLLLREFQILTWLWEQYRHEMRSKQCNFDHMVGIPMPFEYCSVSGTDFDYPARGFEAYNYYDTHGNMMDISTITLKLPLSTSSCVSSTLSYMTTEKLGPCVSYLIEILRSQSKYFNLSSAMMLFDQLICRLIVMHKYGVVHGDLNTDCLRFGSGNACNVLYISDFSTSVQMPSSAKPSFGYHERFVSTLRVKNKIFHFMQDLESAYYIFLLLAFGCLPWDGRIKVDASSSLPMLSEQAGTANPVVYSSSVIKEKDNFWEVPSIILRLIRSKEFELEGDLYHNFTEDLLMTLHSKMKDLMTNCSQIGQDAFMRDINTTGSVPYNAYMGLRKCLASYFRFETLNAFMKDPATEAKIGMLHMHDSTDRRMAWDLSSWCWNHIGVDTKPSGLSNYLQKAMMASVSQGWMRQANRTSMMYRA
ncbi:hypothetical protein BOX15_Mlig006882g1 [Macrostomum lignano]|uniref:Protein kinase domain-containing protein n=1 Tax=Macrostomum lignano TaxID=282301 RepID=A0A267E2Q6_9PLAT|nr:hypothetical protein BOX15_Mlig006882g1 [Macrostomum lignano]